MKARTVDALLLLLLLIGAGAWATGALDFVSTGVGLTIFLLLAGSLEAAAAGFLLFNVYRYFPSEGLGREMSLFCLSAGLGIAAVGLAISRLTAWLLPASFFAIGGALLIVWSPQALSHRDA
jgi:hypothetical protein